MPDSTATPAGPHTDLPHPNCDGVWRCSFDGGGYAHCTVHIHNGVPCYHETLTPVDNGPGDRWTLYVPADSVSSPAVPADRPKPDREDGSYTKPMWSGWWIWTCEEDTVYLIEVSGSKALYSEGTEVVANVWRPAPIADTHDVERLKAKIEHLEGLVASRDRRIEQLDQLNSNQAGSICKLRSERDALAADRPADGPTPEKVLDLCCRLVSFRHGDTDGGLLRSVVSSLMRPF